MILEYRKMLYKKVLYLSEIQPVAYIYTPFPTKFGIPRQSGLCDTVSEIVFKKKYRSAEAIRGLEEFSHLWLIWEFSENKNKSHSLTVRPPRLGGNTRMGVFATRSPFRPNNLGLSSVEIVKIDYEGKNAPVIYVKGADILDGTPIFDIKPYIPYSDCHPEATGGFSERVYENSLQVVFPEKIKNALPEEELKSIENILIQDPRPSYQADPERIYAFELSGYKIKFRVEETTLKVIEICSI